MLGTKPKEPARPKEPRRWTFDALVAELPESNLPTELWDGELVISPAPSFLHQTIVARFYRMLDAWVERHRLGQRPRWLRSTWSSHRTVPCNPT
jgi:Uma2 family endonuclease